MNIEDNREEGVRLESIKEIMSWAKKFQEETPDKILFGKNDIPKELQKDVVRQISYQKKLKSKYPLFYQELFLPANISFEQSSSEITARYKQGYISEQDIVTDGTGGLGIDFSLLSEKSKAGIYMDKEKLFVQAATYNVPQIVNSNACLEFIHGKLEENITKIVQKGTTLLYFDPARRDTQGQKTYLLSDIYPNPLSILESLQKEKYQGRILIKLSPMLDITATLRQIPCIDSLEIISLGGEVKELLAYSYNIYQRKDFQEIPIKVTDLDSSSQNVTSHFEGTLKKESNTPLNIATELKKYLFLPHSGIFKSGLYKTLASELQLQILHRDSHLYTSDTIPPLFPGKSYEIIEIIPFSSSVLKRLSKRFPKADFSARNFPIRPEEFYRRSKIKRGDDKRILGTTIAPNQAVLLILNKI